jgi:hypothetical protein
MGMVFASFEERNQMKNFLIYAVEYDLIGSCLPFEIDI